MPLAITHAFTSAKSDGSDATQVQPSHWNAGHSFTFTSTSYTPAVVGGSGSGGTVTTSGYYFQIGKLVHFSAHIEITANGTWATSLAVQLPVTASGAPASFSGVDASTNNVLSCYLYPPNNNNYFNVYTAAGAYPGATGKHIQVNGTYEAN
jgi:hypothetical protein